MQAKTQNDDDFLSTLPDTTKTGKPYALADKPRGRRTTAAGDDDFLASLPDTTGQKAYSMPYLMTDGKGKSVRVPREKMYGYTAQGYMLDPSEKERLRTTIASEAAASGVKVAGYNAAGQPILTPQGPDQPHGSAARRFLSSAVDALVGPIKGTYHAFMDKPQTPEEQRLASDPIVGPVNLAIQRMIVNPTVAEARKTAEEYAQSGAGPDATEHRILTAVHGLGTAVPLLGPAAAGFVEGTRQKYAQGDIAGALGGGVGNVAAYMAPEGLARVAKSKWLTRSIPHGQITRLIRPMAADLRFGKDPAAAILEEKLVGNNLEQLGDRVYDRLHEVGKQIDAEARKYPNQTVDLTAALRPLDDAMLGAVQSGDRLLFRKLQALRSELTQDWQAVRTPGGRVVMRPTGPRNMSMSPYEALQFKRMIGDRIRWTQDPLEGAVNKSLGDVYGNVKDAVNAQVPGLARLNERYSNLVGAGKAIERRLPIEARNAHWSLSDIVIGTHNLPLAAARHVARLPGVRSRVAAGLYALPGKVPRRPALMAAPVTAAAAAAEEDRRRRLAGQ
jgi:hypothetical protein